jgi:hypothetical protein
MEKNSSQSLFFKKWLPIAGLVLLTVALVLFFKRKNIDDIVHEQGKTIAAFYTQNLKPLFTSSSVSKEDVYNFAFNNSLPLDKSGKHYFRLSDVAEKDNYFEFRNAKLDENENTDLASFEDNLLLTKKQRSKVDSILESYSGDLEKQILVNDKNTIAINYDLWNLNKAIKADVFRYLGLEKIDKLDNVTSLYSTLKDNPAVDKMITEARTNVNDRFIFITPDTIFSHDYRYDEKEMEKKAREIEMKSAELEKQFSNINKNMNLKIAFDKIIPKISRKLSKENIKLKMDNSYCRVEIPDVEIPDIEMPEVDLSELKDLKIELAEMNESLKPIIEKRKRPARSTSVKKSSGGTNSYSESSSYGYELNIPLHDVGEIVNQSLDAVRIALSTSGISEDFADSLAELINASVETSMDDSMSEEDKAEFKKEMEKMKKELKRLKYQNQNNK